MKIGIIGLAGAGKDTFAAMLQAEINLLTTEDLSENLYNIDRYARPLKELTSRIFGLSLDELEDRVIKEKPVQIDRDRAIDKVFHCLSKVLKFTDDEMDRASELYFEHFQSARAISPREFQQLFGTEVVRKIRPTGWVDLLKKRDASLIVPDVRFANETLDFNILVERFENIDKPKHESEHFAWNLQFTGLQVVLDTPLLVVNNRKEITLEQLREQAITLAFLLKQLGA